MRFLFDFLSYTKLSRTVDRNLLLISSLTSKSDNKGGITYELPYTANMLTHFLDSKQRSGNPKEIIKLYDTIIQVNNLTIRQKPFFDLTHYFRFSYPECQ